MRVFLTKSIAVIILASFFVSMTAPMLAGAEVEQDRPATAAEIKQEEAAAAARGATVDQQASNLSSKDSAGGTKTNTTGVAADLLGCSAGALLAQAISMGLSSLINYVAGSAIETTTKVPTTIVGTQAAANLDADTKAHTVQHFMGVPFGASLDAMGWCIVNSIISYIADATIQWANTGFKGNPAFVQNPERFFEAIADKEAGTFIQQLAYNTTGLNVCQPFRVQIAIGLAESYGNRNTGNNLGCSIQQVKQNVNTFAQNPVSIGTTGGNTGGGLGAVGLQGGNTANNQNRVGNQINGYWSNWNQQRQPNNNIWGAYQLANDQLYARASVKQNAAQIELGLNKGWLSFKKCTDPKDTKSCNTYTPGSLIESSLEKSLGIPKDRLVAVQKFDQVITAVVNNLIKVALNKALESNSNNGSK